MKHFLRKEIDVRAWRRLLAVPAAIALSAVLVACDDDDATSPAATEDSASADGTDGDDPFGGLKDVAAEKFSMKPIGDYYAFDFSTGGNVVGLCSGAGGSMTCTGQAETSVPDLTGPFPGRPGAINLDNGETEYTTVEGVPPPKGKLNPGEKVSIDGITCGAIDDTTLTCADDGASFSITGSDRMIAVGKGSSGRGAAAPSPTRAKAPEIRDIDPDVFAVNDTGKSAWVLEDQKTHCWVMEARSASPGVGCNVQLDNPPSVPGTTMKATKFDLQTSGEATLGPDIAGYVPFPYKTLGADERVTVRGITCTAHGGSDITCAAGGTTVEIKDGHTPDLPVDDGGLASSSNRGGSTTKTSGSCGTIDLGDRGKKDLMVRDGRVDCDDVLPIVQEYVDTPADPYHGQWNVREYGTWSCSMPSAGQVARTGYSISCGTMDGKSVGIRAD